MKNGFTLIEVLSTTIIFSLFMLVSYPLLNNISKSFNELSVEQIKNIECIRLYQKFNQISNSGFEMYYRLEDKISITIDSHTILFDNENTLYIDNNRYGFKLVNYVIDDNMIILNCYFENEYFDFILRGKVYENSWS